MHKLAWVLTAAALAGSFARPAAAEKVKFAHFAIGCPAEDGLIAVYRAVDQSADTIEAIVNHYDCQMFEKGVQLTLISHNALVSVVDRPRVFSKDDWLYVRTIDLEH